VEADNGYVGDCPAKCKVSDSVTTRRDQRKMRGRLQMRHETINERLKNFQCLKIKLCQRAIKHASRFRAVAMLMQLAIESGEEMFDMQEYDDRLSDAEIVQLYGL
jgi:hypothetical protein